jgi:hypothetical protein
MNDATLAQGNQMMSLILQKKTPARNLQQLLASGLQSMLLDACNESNLATVNPFAFRKSLGLKVVDVTPYGIKHKFKVEGITSFDSFIDHHLARFGFDCEQLKMAGGSHSLSFTNEFEKRLYAVNESELKYAASKLSKADIAPASLSELVKFAFLNPMLEGWISATVIALGSYWNLNKQESQEREYPFIRYDCGEINACGRMRSNTTIANGYPDSNHRFFFLGMKPAGKGEN